jgi:hypothetical protein
MAGQVQAGSRWRRLFGRWTASDEQRDAEQLRDDSVRSGCAFAGEINRGDLVPLVVASTSSINATGPRTTVPHVRWLKIHKLYAKGRSLPQLARDYRVSLETIRAIVHSK